MSITLKATLKELETAKITYEVRSRGPSHKVWFTIDGQRHLAVCSRTASDYRAARNAQMTVRRLIRHAVNRK